MAAKAAVGKLVSRCGDADGISIPATENFMMKTVGDRSIRNSVCER
jgi:hypothetical protein